MGTASGVVAALVAAVFAVLGTAVRDQRDSTSAARDAQQVINPARDTQLSLAKQEDPNAALAHLRKLVADNAEQAKRVGQVSTHASRAQNEATLTQIIDVEQANADRKREDADSKAK